MLDATSRTLVIALLTAAVATLPGVARADRCDFCDEATPGSPQGPMDPVKCRNTCDPAEAHPCLETCYDYFSGDADTEACWLLYCQGELEECPGFADDDEWTATAVGGTPSSEDLLACARHHIPDDPGSLRLIAQWAASSGFEGDWLAGASGSSGQPAELSHATGFALSLGYQRRSGSIFELSWAHTEAKARPRGELELDHYELSFLLPVAPYGGRRAARRSEPTLAGSRSASRVRRRDGLFLLLGVGWMEADGSAVPGLDVDDSLTAHAGVAFEHRLGRRWFLRADARGRYLEAASELVGEGRLGVGLCFD